MTKNFSKNHTNLIKGVATLLLLFHHLFYRMTYFDTCFVWSDLWIRGLNYIAVNAKVCVALFLFLSGYGLVKSAKREKQPVTLKFSALRIVKILLPLWFVYILFVPLGYAFGRTFTDVYGEGISSIFYMCTDLTGTSYLLGFYPKANETWWFFGEIIRLYFLFPLFYYGIKGNSLLTFFVGLLLGLHYGLVWFLPFIIGMIFAEKNALLVVMQQRGLRKLLCIFINLCLIILFTIIRQKYGVIFDGFYAVSILCFVLCVFSPERIVGKGLAFIGEHSANIFMFHTFIYSKYLRKFIFSFKYPVLIFVMLTLICLVVSVGIEGLKKLLRYEKLYVLANRVIEYIFDKSNALKERVVGLLRAKQ